MGRRTRLQGDPALAKPHAAGATVVPLQILTHDPYGAIGYSWTVEFWLIEAQLAQESFDKLKELHEKVFELEPGPSAMRSIHDRQLLKAIYEAGTDMVSHATRSVQHLAQCMERQKGTTLREGTATERIREATAFFGLDDHHTDPGYQGFVELLNTRDAIEHPTMARVFTGSSSQWDKVPLAWLISDRSLKAFELHTSWLHLLTDGWQAHLDANAKPMTLTIGTRGLKSVMSVKKSPKRS
jgi:hypothetical protein